MNKATSVTVFIVLSAVFLLWVTSKSLPIVLVFIPGLLISAVVYFKTAYRKAPEPTKLLPLYLFALAVQMLHFAEEYLTGFNVKIAVLFGHEPYSLEDLLLFNMIAYFFFILGGIILLKKIRELMIIPIAFIMLGVVFNGIAHLCTAIYSGGYFPGLYTALIYLLLAPIIIKVLWKETRTGTANNYTK